MEPTEQERIRLATFIDGEGCIRICKRPKGRRKNTPFVVQVEVTNTDPRLALWCSTTFGGRFYKKTTQKHNRLQFCWCVSAMAAEKILLLCLPYFLLKREQAEVALACRRTVKNTGRELSPSVIAFRLECRDKLSALKKELPPVAEELASCG